MFVRNAWYVAAFAHECNDRPLARTLLGEPVVMFRTPAGECVALQDRCCHRFAPLSLGDVEADGIRCRYHGMKFSPQGNCIEIPGQDKIPPKMCVRSFPLIERHGLVWIWPGDPQLADPQRIVDVHWNDDPAWPTARGYIHYQANYQLIADNLLDFSHLTYVHRSTLANAAFANSHPTITPFGHGIRLSRDIANCDPSPCTRWPAASKARSTSGTARSGGCPRCLRTGPARPRRALQALHKTIPEPCICATFLC